MTVFRGIGCSGDTPTKQEHLRQLLRVHFKICKSTMQKPWVDDQTYYWFDLNAGNGFDPENGGPGGAMVFREEITMAGMDYRAVLIEKNPEYCESLDAIFHEDSKVAVVCGDNRVEFPRFFNKQARWNFGLIYMDPNGIPNWDLLADASKAYRFQHTDILVNCPATAIKRARKLNTIRLSKAIQTIQKKHVILRNPLGKWQWSLLIFTNWIDFPALNRIGFHKINTDAGDMLLHRLDKTKQELALFQSVLWDVSAATTM